MSFASKHNHEPKFNIDTKDWPYVNLSDLKMDHIYKLDGFYINYKSQFDPAPVFMTEKMLVNMPTHLTKECQLIMENDVEIAEIKDGKVGFELRSYKDKKGKDRLTISWVDI